MTERERLAAVNGEIRSARERLSVALQSMDYEAALSCQMEIDRLERAAHLLRHRHPPLHLREIA
jgi:hypothetical protein